MQITQPLRVMPAILTMLLLLHMMRMQGMLLRFLETGELQKVGADGATVLDSADRTSAIDIAAIQRAGSGDLNNHSVSVAHLLTGTRALQRSGIPCSGGARSIDQELAVRTAAPGRFGSRVYGHDYIPNATVATRAFS